MPRIHVRNVSTETIDALNRISSASGAGIGEIVNFCIAASESEAMEYFDQKTEVLDQQDREAVREELLQLFSSELKPLLATLASILPALSDLRGALFQNLHPTMDNSSRNSEEAEDRSQDEFDVLLDKVNLGIAEVQETLSKLISGRVEAPKSSAPSAS